LSADGQCGLLVFLEPEMKASVPRKVDVLSRGQVEKRAMEVLKRHGLHSIPVDPVVLANSEGIKVHNARFAEEGVSGMVAKRGDDLTLLVNQNDPPYRKRFTIAHELGHHFLHLVSDGEFVDTVRDLFRDTEHEKELSDEKRAEIQANQFAAALLMPRDLVEEAWAKDPSLLDLARLFNVSEQAIGIRLNVLGLG